MLTNAINIVFKDPEWVAKLAITMIVTLISVFLSPVLVGIGGFAILLGWQIQLIRNVRLDVRAP